VTTDGGKNVESLSDCGFKSGKQNTDPAFTTGLVSNGGETPPIAVGAHRPPGGLAGARTGFCQPGGKSPPHHAWHNPAMQYKTCPPPQATPTPTPAPSATPTPTPTATPVPTPVFKKSVVVQPVKGKVRVRVPGSNKFIDLAGVDDVPLGSTIDTKHGTVELT